MNGERKIIRTMIYFKICLVGVISGRAHAKRARTPERNAARLQHTKCTKL